MTCMICMPELCCSKHQAMKEETRRQVQANEDDSVITHYKDGELVSSQVFRSAKKGERLD